MKVTDVSFEDQKKFIESYGKLLISETEVKFKAPFMSILKFGNEHSREYISQIRDWNTVEDIILSLYKNIYGKMIKV